MCVFLHMLLPSPNNDHQENDSVIKDFKFNFLCIKYSKSKYSIGEKEKERDNKNQGLFKEHNTAINHFNLGQMNNLFLVNIEIYSIRIKSR